MERKRPPHGGPESADTGEVRFHYSRNERLQHHSAQLDGNLDQRRRRLNRRLLIILLDIVLVSSVYLIFVFFLQPDDSTATLHGVRFSSQAGYFDQQLLVRVSAERLEEHTRPELISLQVFRETEQGSTDMLAEDLDTLDAEQGALRRFHLQLGPYESPPQQLRIRLELRSDRIDLLPQMDDF